VVGESSFEPLILADQITRPTETPRPASHAGTRWLAVVFALGYCLLAAGLSITATLPEVRRTIVMSDTITSLHGSFFGWGLIVAGLFGAVLVSRIGRRNTLIGTTIGMAGGAAVFGTGTTVLQTLAGAAIVGISAALFVVVVPGLVADAFGDQRTEVFTQINMAPALAGFSFPLAVAGAPSVGLNWRWPTVVIPACVLFCIAVLSRRVVGLRVAGGEQGTTSAWAILQPLKTNPYVRKRCLLQVLQVSLEFSVGVWSVTYLRENVGFSRNMAPLGAAAWAVGMLISRGLVPHLIGLLGRHLEVTCFLGGGLGVSLLISTHNRPLALFALTFIAFSFGPTYPLTVERLFLRSNAPTTHTSSLSAIASGIAISVGPLLVGRLSDTFGLRVALLTVPGAALVGVALCLGRWGGEAGHLGQHSQSEALRSGD
jgi:MFS family permease